VATKKTGKKTYLIAENPPHQQTEPVSVPATAGPLTGLFGSGIERRKQTMTAGELKAKLAGYPDDMPVVLSRDWEPNADLTGNRKPGSEASKRHRHTAWQRPGSTANPTRTYSRATQTCQPSDTKIPMAGPGACQG